MKSSFLKNSCGGIFSSLSHGRGAIDVHTLCDGVYTLFLHTGATTAPLGKIEKTGEVIKRVVTDKEIENTERICAELYGRICEAEKRILALEASVFASTIF